MKLIFEFMVFKMKLRCVVFVGRDDKIMVWDLWKIFIVYKWVYDSDRCFWIVIFVINS